MEIIRDNIRLCYDCHIVAATGETDHIDAVYSDDSAQSMSFTITSGLEELPGLVPNGNDDEFSASICDCCGTRLAGFRAGYSQLGTKHE